MSLLDDMACCVIHANSCPETTKFLTREKIFPVGNHLVRLSYCRSQAAYFSFVRFKHKAISFVFPGVSLGFLHSVSWINMAGTCTDGPVRLASS